MEQLYKMKSELRQWAKKERKKLDMEALSLKLVKKLQEIPEYKQAKNIMIFYPLPNEVNLLPLLKDTAKKFYLPKIDGENLLCCPYEEGAELCESCFNTKEPLTPEAEFSPDIVIVPALAVDKNNYRLGYGGGFYDRFLASKLCTTIVCIPSEFVVDSVFPEKFDVCVDKVITE